MTLRPGQRFIICQTRHCQEPATHEVTLRSGVVWLMCLPCADRQNAAVLVEPLEEKP